MTDEMNQHRRQADAERSRPGPRPAEAAGRGEERSFSRDADRADDGGSEHPLIPAKRVNGTAVFNQAGEEIGKVEDVAIDKRTGKVAYAILSFGGFLGIGEKHQPLPWSALNYDTDRDGYVIDVTEEFLRLAPKLETSDLSGWDDTSGRDQFYSYYAPLGARPYW